MVEYHHARLDHYFITADPAEMRDLDAGRHAGWTRTGESFFAYADQRSDRRGTPVLRWYGLPAAGLNTHFYARIGEISGYVPPDQEAKWLMEGIVFEMGFPFRDGSCPARSVPVHRLWNARVDTNHRYTTSREIRDRMVAMGYVAEGYGADAVMLCAVAP